MAEKPKKTGLDLLREPFPPNQISLLPKPKSKDAPKGRCPDCGGWHGLPAVHLSYVGHAALTDRLLDVDPNWTWEPLALKDGLPALDANGGLWIRLTVCGVTRLGYGDAQGKQGGDAMKERIGDALRNAAMRFGAALDLWHKGDLHAHEEAESDGKPSAEDLAQRFRAALTAEYPGTTEEAVEAARAAAVVAVHNAANYDEDFYREVWSLLSAPDRRAIKAYIDMARKAA